MRCQTRWKRWAERPQTRAATRAATATTARMGLSMSGEMVPVRSPAGHGRLRMPTGLQAPGTGERSPVQADTSSAELLHAVDHGLRVERGGRPVVVPHALVAGGLHEHGRLLDREQDAPAADDALVAVGVGGVEHVVHRVALVDDVVVVPVPRRGADVHEHAVGRGDHPVGGGQVDRRQAARAVALEGERPCP